jgi:hypothetical protein
LSSTISDDVKTTKPTALAPIICVFLTIMFLDIYDDKLHALLPYIAELVTDYNLVTAPSNLIADL